MKRPKPGRRRRFRYQPKTLFAPSHTIQTAATSSSASIPKAVAPPVPPLVPSQPVDAGYDIILLIDSSGSMKQTDPRNYF